ncbi:hypothetical protein OQA88_10891 [Cercophora sp. LCS_1]
MQGEKQPPDSQHNGRDVRTHRRLVSYPWRASQLFGLCAAIGWVVLSLPRLARKLDHFVSSNGSLTYAGESISWTACGTKEEPNLFECSSVDVPLDHFNASNNLNGRHFTIPLVRLRVKTATRNILFNPGGPGGSGAEFIRRAGPKLATIVGDDFHLVGFDPRGISGSRPLATCYQTDEARLMFPRIKPKHVSEDSGDLWAWATNHAHACADVMGEFAAHINSPQTAADMNTILDALGQKDMYYWGLSYGTVLGATYSTLFPERAKRVIIDGVLNQFQWYQSLLEYDSAVDQDNVYSGLLEECVKAGPKLCALAQYAATKGELSEKLLSMARKLTDDPVGVYINKTLYGILDHTSLWINGVFASLYRPASWPQLAKNLVAVLDGNATDAFLSYQWKGYESWRDEGDSGFFVYYNDAPSGSEHWPQDHRALVDELSPVLNASLFSEGSFDSTFVRAAWAIPKRHTYIPTHGVETAHPLLVLSTTYDPVCPLISAKNATGTFTGARLVEVKGYGHSSLAVPSLCAARHVRAFFKNGTLPEEKHVRCEVDGNPYFGDTASVAFFEDPEDQKIHAAQVLYVNTFNFQGRPFQTLLSIALLVACLLCYTLLFILYLAPHLYRVESFVHPDIDIIRPAAVVGLLAAILAALNVPFGFNSHIPHRLSLPDQEPSKRSPLLRPTGPLLVAATLAVGPVLLAGISQSTIQTTTVTSVPLTVDQWEPRFDASNRRYRGGQAADTPTTIAALAAMRNFTAPVANVCDDITDPNRQLCSVSATTISIRAECTGQVFDNPDGIGLISSGKSESHAFCAGSGTDRELCVKITTSSPSTCGAFATGLHPCARDGNCPGLGVDGTWARLLGVRVNGVDLDLDTDHKINQVVCLLTHGTAVVTQNGTLPPTLDRNAFAPMQESVGMNYGGSNIAGSVTALNRIYTESTSPYSFNLAAVGTGDNTAYRTPIGYLLLGDDAVNGAEEVARQIERNFDTATLHAFARGPESSDLVFTRGEVRGAYVYQPLALLVLLVPFAATVLGTWGRWRVGSAEEVVGYDPVAIARLGPVGGVGVGGWAGGEGGEDERGSVGGLEVEAGFC